MPFSTRYIGEYNTALRLDLKDSGALWSDAELLRCVERAVDDLSRFYPLEVAYELTYRTTVTGESWTSGAAHGTYVALANKPIKPESETVTNVAGTTTYTRDTDYTIDYFNGKITTISGGSMAVLTAYKIGYTKSRLGINIAAIITDLIRVSRVEYPADRIPQQFVSYSIWDDFMYIGSQKVGESQTQITDREHIVIYYDKKHTAPATATAPTYPGFMDEVACIGAGAYALFVKALQFEHQAVTDLASMRTALGSIAAIHTLTATALGKVTTYATDMDTALDAFITNIAHATTALGKVDTYLAGASESTKFLLAKITTDAAELRTAIETALDGVATYLTGASAPSTKKYLDDGDAFINTVNVGSDVAENYANYAATCVGLANGLISEATVRLANLRAYIEQANGYTTIAEGFIAEGSQRSVVAEAFISEANGRYNMCQAFLGEAAGRMGQMDRYLTEARQYQDGAGTDMLLADRFRAEALERFNEFYGILKNRAEYRKRVSTTAVTQPA